MRVVFDTEGCPATFTTVDNMHRHMRSVHKGVRVACDAEGCPATFTKVGAMRRHMRSVHEGVQFD